MVMKRFKLLVLGLSLMAGVMLVACSENTPTATPTKEPATPSAEAYTGALAFLEKGTARIEVYDLDVNISYGNEAIVAPYKVVTISDSARFSVNKSTTVTDVYNFVTYVEKSNGAVSIASVNKEITGDGLQGYFDEVFKDTLVGYERAFVSISKGEVKWTKGLSQKMDADLNLKV